MEAVIDIICPKCSQKALFYSRLEGNYQLYPDRRGKVVCPACGFNGDHLFSNGDYFYQLEIHGRRLFAGNRYNLIALRDFFREGYKNKKREHPELDFPGEFYAHKKEIVTKINRLLEREKD